MIYSTCSYMISPLSLSLFPTPIADTPSAELRQIFAENANVPRTAARPAEWRRAVVPSQSTPAGNITAAAPAPSCTAHPTPPMAPSTPLVAPASTAATGRGGGKGRRVSIDSVPTVFMVSESRLNQPPPPTNHKHTTTAGEKGEPA